MGLKLFTLRWRQAPFAQEQMHAGLLRPDSVDAPALLRQSKWRKKFEAPSVEACISEVGLPFDYQSPGCGKLYTRPRLEYFNSSMIIIELSEVRLSIDIFD